MPNSMDNTLTNQNKTIVLTWFRTLQKRFVGGSDVGAPVPVKSFSSMSDSDSRFRRKLPFWSDGENHFVIELDSVFNMMFETLDFALWIDDCEWNRKKRKNL